MNHYLYALANPATLVDPSGHAACLDVGTTCVPSVEGNNQLAKNKAKANRRAPVSVPHQVAPLDQGMFTGSARSHAARECPDSWDGAP